MGNFFFFLILHHDHCEQSVLALDTADVTVHYFQLHSNWFIKAETEINYRISLSVSQRIFLICSNSSSLSFSSSTNTYILLPQVILDLTLGLMVPNATKILQYFCTVVLFDIY